MALKALTLIQPMASAIVIDHPNRKNIENRPRGLPKDFVGKKTVVAVHAGLKWSEEYAKNCLEILGPGVWGDTAANVGGHIIGLMELTGKQYTTEALAPYLLSPYGNTSICNPWFLGPFGYEIGRAVALPNPIPCKGNINFWNVPEEIEKQIWDQAPDEWL